MMIHYPGCFHSTLWSKSGDNFTRSMSWFLPSHLHYVINRITKNTFTHVASHGNCNTSLPFPAIVNQVAIPVGNGPSEHRFRPANKIKNRSRQIKWPAYEQLQILIAMDHAIYCTVSFRGAQGEVQRSYLEKFFFVKRTAVLIHVVVPWNIHITYGFFGTHFYGMSVFSDAFLKSLAWRL